MGLKTVCDKWHVGSGNWVICSANTHENISGLALRL